MESATERISRIIWKNGEWFSESKATVSIYDSALLFGDMVFEMTRSFNGEQFKLREHLERLEASAHVVRIPMPYSIMELESACRWTVAGNLFAPDDEHRLMINVSRGILPIYKDTGKTGTNVIISDFPLRWTVQGMGKLFDTGVNAVVVNQQIGTEPRVKSRSRLHFMLANIEASEHKGTNNWALLLDRNGYIAEGTGANFFIVRNGMTYTPKKYNVLAGISRQFISEISSYSYETDIMPYDVLNADEAFFTGTPFCIMPVTSFNGQPIADGGVGRTTQTLLKRWGDRVGVDIVGQIKAWDTGAVSGPSPYQFKGATL
jgi:branched-chain amino acid aminotransferase